MTDQPRKPRPPQSRKPNRPRPASPDAPARPASRRPPEGWDAVASWYDGWVGKGGSEHHKRLAIPAVTALLQAKPGEQVLDIGCGTGVLAAAVARTGAKYTGLDVSPKLLELARKHHGADGRFVRGDAAALLTAEGIRAAAFDAVVFLLSIQDMNPLAGVITSAASVLKPGGRAVLLMTHPAFRVPRQSGWGFDEGRKLVYRRVDRYLTPLPVPMKQHASGVTISFHRPLSEYINTLGEAGLWTDRIEEIPAVETGLKKTRDKAQEQADAEIPLFLALRAQKVR